MELSDLHSERVAILGFGQEGQAVAEFLVSAGIKPVIFDHKPWENWPEDLQTKIKSWSVNIITGPDCLKELGGFEVAFRSPGLPFLHPDLQAWVKKGMKLTSQTDWFFRHCPARIIGVTGTKGKGTTCALIYQILQTDFQETNAKSKVFLTGNIGKTEPLKLLGQLNPSDWVVFELSSFQLQDLTISPHIGVVLMVTEDHLDHHKNLEEYHQAKTAICRYQSEHDFCVSCQDYPASQNIGRLGSGQKYFTSRKQAVSRGCYAFKGQIFAPALFGEAGDKPFMPTEKLLLRGEHNLENVCAATAAAALAGALKTHVIEGCVNFRGLEHRLQMVGTYNGIHFYDDSISTNPQAAIAALHSFFEPMIMILGGSSKNSDFSQLASELTKKANTKAVVLIGQEAGRIHTALLEAGFGGQIFTDAPSMQAAVMQAKSAATAGDVILLSPACASFGMFKNYQERGHQFVQAAKETTL
jgi:UDP-N-acetylmuramoylalanine--D-glutamate ligase